MTRLNHYLFGTVFITGAAVLVLEVAAVRVLAPHYGSSLYVFSSVLTVILAALSLGYWYGGRRADMRHSIDDLYRIIAISGVIVLVLLFAAVVLLPSLSQQFSVKTGPLVFSVGLFFMPAFLLGIVSPYIIKLQSLNTPGTQIGAVVGKTFFFGTVGSIVGSLATGFWFIPAIGVQQTIILTSVILIALGLVTPLFLGRPLFRRFIVGTVAIALLFGVLVHAFAVAIASQYVYRDEGLYSSITIQDFERHGRPARLLMRDTNNSSAIYRDSTELLFPYTQFAMLYERLLPNAEEYLVLGGGAYTVPRTLIARDDDIMVDVVEIEPILYDLAKEYFDLPETPRITNFPEDARVHLRNSDAQYDVMFIDTFGTDLAAPFHLTTREFYELARAHLHEDGILILNYVGVPKGPRPSLTGSVIKTLTSVFPNTRAFALDRARPDALQNIMFVARNGDTPIDIGGTTIQDHTDTTVAIAQYELPLASYDLTRETLLTDDHAPVEYLMTKQR